MYLYTKNLYAAYYYLKFTIMISSSLLPHNYESLKTALILYTSEYAQYTPIFIITSNMTHRITANGKSTNCLVPALQRSCSQAQAVPFNPINDPSTQPVFVSINGGTQPRISTV